jgi:hypothetical protein
MSLESPIRIYNLVKYLPQYNATYVQLKRRIIPCNETFVSVLSFAKTPYLCCMGVTFSVPRKKPSIYFMGHFFRYNNNY